MGEAIKLKDVRTAVIEHIKLEAVGCKHAVIFKDTVCLSKNKWTNGQNIHDAFVYGLMLVAIFMKMQLIWIKILIVLEKMLALKC